MAPDNTSDSLPEELSRRLKALESEGAVSYESHPNQEGASETADQDEAQSTVARRRSSIATNKSGLTFKDLPSAFPPPIPESLPTTPGNELSQQMFEKSYKSTSRELPTQQRPKLTKNDTTKSFTNLLRRDSVESQAPKVNPNVMSIRNPPKNLYRVIAACVWTFMLGMNDGVLGAILTKIEEYYGISYGVVSLIWLGNAIGFVVIAFTAHHLDNYLGRQKMATLSSAFFAIAFGIISSGTKFVVICIGFFFAGLGGGIGLSQYNIFLSKLQNPSIYLGIFHGTYGFGAFIAPLIGTSMVNQRGVQWSYYYFIPLALSLVSTVFSYWAFEGCAEDLKKWEFVENPHDTDIETPPAVTETNSVELDYLNRAETNKAEVDEESHNFKAAMSDVRTWLVCAWIFFYQGAEVSMGGWVVTFLMDYRGGSENDIGYVSSGFWAGVTIGRFVLTHLLATKVGVRRGILILSGFIIIFDILAWLIPNTYGAGVFACLIGLCIGPLYPMMVSLVTRILPRKIRFCSLTLGSAFGSSGGSVVPFAIGMASEFVGTYVLHPIFLACYAMVIISWICLPNIERKGAIKNIWQRLW